MIMENSFNVQIPAQGDLTTELKSRFESLNLWYLTEEMVMEVLECDDERYKSSVVIEMKVRKSDSNACLNVA